MGRLANWFPAAVLGILAFAVVLLATEPPGPGIDPDALAYLGAAESVAAGTGYRVPVAPWTSADSTAPLAHFPPGYSTALAVPVRLGLPAVQAARLVNALAAGVTVATLVLLVSAAAAPLAGILLAAALFAMPAMHTTHASVLSEPLFLACVALTLAAMTAAPDRPLPAGLAAALGSMTRYAGVALVGAVVLRQLLRDAPVAHRLRRALVALVPALVLQGAWILRTRRVAGPSAIRRFAFNGGMEATLRQGGETLRDWLAPSPAWTAEPVPHRGVVALLAAALLVAVLARAATHAAAPDEQAAHDRAARLLAAVGLLAACYVATLVASRLVADAGIPFDERLLAPLLLLASTAAAVAIARWWRSVPAATPRLLAAAALLGWWAASASVTADAARYALDWGSDFAGREWRESPLLSWARAAGARHPLYTNWPVAVYAHLHRPAHALPALAEGAGSAAAFADTLRRRDGRVLAFAVAGPEYATAGMLRAGGALRVVATFDDGVVLAPAPAAAPQRENRTAVPGVYTATPPARGGTAHPRIR